MGIFDRFKDKGRKEEERPRADFSDVEAGGSSTAAPDETAATTTYTVQSGDSLWKISEKFYGDGNQWRRIYEANVDQIKDPDLIHPGQELTIPAAEEVGE